jgi:co-chaperonin GroES (HSP10)|tara:strand:+ start:516 stop:887 length:372 start_codon:yes stop_codon:yes gene_type:complete
MTEAVKLTDNELEQQLPRPVGYRVLIALPEIEKTYGNTSVLKTDKEVHHDYIMSIMGLVVDMGDGAYGDKERFPDGAWCKQGDFVMFRANSGTRFKVAGKEYRLLNDDSIEAVVTDPRGITRA